MNDMFVMRCVWSVTECVCVCVAESRLYCKIHASTNGRKGADHRASCRAELESPEPVVQEMDVVDTNVFVDLGTEMHQQQHDERGRPRVDEGTYT
jgi:hypothetical protein